jgi:inositol phosphorylceramide mannosyltransferase catalytic subunit
MVLMRLTNLRRYSTLIITCSIAINLFNNVHAKTLKHSNNTPTLNDMLEQMKANNKNFFYKAEFEKTRDLLIKHVVKQPSCKNQLRIPKIIHQIWLGCPFPEKYRAFQASWTAMHPDWKYCLWTEKEIDELNLINKKQYDQTRNFGCKSDIARYEILYRFGGLYIDTDFECLKSFDILHYSFDFYACCVDDDKFAIANGIMACKAGHPILKKCIDNLKNKNVSSNNFEDIMANTGPYFLTNCFLESLPNAREKNVIFPSTIFFPFPHQCRHTNDSLQTIKNKWIRQESFAIHWWECSWQKK